MLIILGPTGVAPHISINTNNTCKPAGSQARQEVKADELKNKYNINHLTGQVNEYAKI